jgi:hypothetical protein
MVDFASLPEISSESRTGLRMSNYEKTIRQHHPHLLKDAGNFGVGGQSGGSSTGGSKKKSTQAFKNKKDQRDRKKKINVVDARGCVERFDAGRINGDSIISIRQSEPADIDSLQFTVEEFLKREKNVSPQSDFSANRQDSPVAFQQGVSQELSSGAKKLNSNAMRGTGFGGSGAGGGGGSAGTSSSAGTIGLPTPDNLQENMNIGYESKHKGMGQGIQDAMMNAVSTSLRNMAATGNPVNESMISNMQSTFADMKSFYAKDGNIANFLGALGNMAGMGNFDTMFNNSMVQQFSGVMPRSFNFRWKLYADSEAGSSAIFQIIQIFKEAAHPTLVDPLLNIVRYPARLSRFDIRSPNGLIIFPVFESVITDITVDYSASGAPFFFKSGAPTSVALSLSITEVTSKTRNDYAAAPSGFA